VLSVKKMNCKQLAGACDMEFHAETFEEMAKMSKKHAMEMVEKGDKAHLRKMDEMKELMERGEAVRWFEGKRKEFDNLPVND